MHTKIKILVWIVIGILTIAVSAANVTATENTTEHTALLDLFYLVVDTGQTQCYNNTDSITAPAQGSSFYGQDAQYNSTQPSYTDNGNGTVTDLNTGLMWQQDPGSDKNTYDAAVSDAGTFDLAGYSDWRLPSIKELYSLIDFNGVDPSGYNGTDTSSLTPFINTNYFVFRYGDTSNGERIIDAQYASSNLYVSTTANDGGRTLFGVNFADGRIKGYGLSIFGRDKTFYVMYVRGDTQYGMNNFSDNSDDTITDLATGLMWQKKDSTNGLTWQAALAYAENLELAGYRDWRLPNAKELQNILDYTRSPDTTSSAATDPVFFCSPITNEAGQLDYPCYWTGTTHVNYTDTPGPSAAYIAFGRAMGYLDNTWQDVHGAGAQRSDPKTGNPDDYPYGRGPQGDAIRIYNYARCVRDAPIPEPSSMQIAAAIIVGALLLTISER